MASFGAIALKRWHESGALFLLLFGLRDWIAAYFFWVRKEASSEGHIGHAALAYISTSLPLFCSYPVQGSGVLASLLSNLLVIVGFLVVTLATIELADRIGVTPAKRGEICRSGIYRLFSHPMYLGYAIAELGAVVLNPKNVPIYLLAISLYWWRAKIENTILNRHSEV